MARVNRQPPQPEKAVKSPLPMKPPAAPLELIELDEEARQVRAERGYQLHGQSAKTLVRYEHFRVVLIVLKAGRRCQQHQAEESLSLQTLQGRIKIHFASGEEIELRSGCVLAIAPLHAHDIEAVEDSTLLLTMAWTGDRREHPPDGQLA